MVGGRIIRKGQVTDHHIEIGTPTGALTCALALSLQDTLENESIGVKARAIEYLDSDGFYQEYRISKKVRYWIRSFDEGYEVEPFQYKIKDNIVSMVEEEESCEVV